MDKHKKESFTSCFYATVLQIIQKFLATTAKNNNSKITAGHLVRTSTKIMALVLITQITAEYTVNTTTTGDQNITYIHLNNSKTSYNCEGLKIRLCILEIVTNNTDSAIRLFEELHSNENYTLIYTIVKQAYANDTKNVPKLVSFITKLPWCNHQYAGLELLFDQLKLAKRLNTSEALQFAYHLKKFLDGDPECQHVRDDENLHARIKNLKNGFPDGIRFLIWNGTKLCLKNRKFDEFLYAADYYKYDNERRRVFTWIPKRVIGTQGEWTFEPVADAKLFRIKNEHYQEHLYAADCCKYDRDRRSVFTWTPKGDVGSQGDWTLELIDESNLFKIRSSHYAEYLYAAACCKVSPKDDNRRSVFTWIPRGDAGEQGEWEIAPCA